MLEAKLISDVVDALTISEQKMFLTELSIANTMYFATGEERFLEIARHTLVKWSYYVGVKICQDTILSLYIDDKIRH